MPADVCMTGEHGCNLNTSDCISGHGNIAQRCKCKDGFQTKDDACVKGSIATVWMMFGHDIDMA